MVPIIDFHSLQSDFLETYTSNILVITTSNWTDTGRVWMEQMLSSMETNNFENSPSLEPPRKIRRIAHSEFSTMAQAFTAFKPSRVTIIQWIQTTLALAKDKANTRYHPLYNEVDKNLTIFNLDGCEFLAVNAPLTAISTWQNQTLPYQHFWVKNVEERRNAIMRAGVMLAGLYGLPPCA